jgi:hypothetical protein
MLTVLFFNTIVDATRTIGTLDECNVIHGSKRVDELKEKCFENQSIIVSTVNKTNGYATFFNTEQQQPDFTLFRYDDSPNYSKSPPICRI